MTVGNVAAAPTPWHMRCSQCDAALWFEGGLIGALVFELVVVGAVLAVSLPAAWSLASLKGSLVAAIATAVLPAGGALVVSELLVSAWLLKNRRLIVRPAKPTL